VRRAVGSADDAQDVAFFHDRSSPSILTSVPDHFPKRMRSPALTSLAALVAPARTDGDHPAFLRLLLGGIGDDDSAFGLLFALEALNYDPVMQGTECHVVSFLFWASPKRTRPVAK
jgi:hypothetical protein